MLWDADSNRAGFTSSTGGKWQLVYDVTAGIPAVVEELTPSGSVYSVGEINGGLACAGMFREGSEQFGAGQLRPLS